MVLVAILILYVVRDVRLVFQYKRDLKSLGFELQPGDMVQFALLNWCVPLIDAAQIVKGYIVTKTAAYR